MIQVCICDDEREQCQQLRELVEQYSFNKQGRGFALVPSVVTDPALLLQNPNAYHIIFLDVRFGQKPTGMDTGIELHRRGSKSFIIFVSNHKQYLQRGYQAAAFRYLLKPVQERELKDALDGCLKQLTVRNQKRVFTAKTKDQTYRVFDADEILYIETSLISTHRRVVHLAEGDSVEISESFAELDPRLPTGLFGRPHRSYLVSFRHLQGFNQSKITMAGGLVLPVGRNYKQAFFQQLAAYVGHDPEV